MHLKVNDQFIPIPEDIEVEKVVNLFENILEIDGDFSYASSVPDTAAIREILGLTDISDANKTLYQKISAQITDDSGQIIHDGFIRIESILDTINFSFFSGNSNWIDQLSDSLLSLDLSQYNTDKSSISTSWDNTDGIVFPLMNTGILTNRNDTANLEEEDFHPCIYVKNIITSIFNKAGFKLTGDIVNDWVYNNMILTSNSKSATQALINSRSSKAGKVATRAMNETFQKITFTNDTDVPYYDGLKNNYDTVNSRYTADVHMLVKIDCLVNLDAIKDFDITVYKNGVEYPVTRVRSDAGFLVTVPASQGWINYSSALYTTQVNYNQPVYFEVSAGDYLEMFFALDAGEGTVNITSGYFTVTPVEFKTVLPESLLPNITQAEFIAGVFSLFNPIVEFDTYSKTVDVNFFGKIKSRPFRDWSNYIDRNSVEENYIDFIQDYAKKVNFNYDAGDDDDIESYNDQNDICYGCGRIEVDNFYLEDTVDLDFPFNSVPAQFNDLTGAYIPKFNFVTSTDFSQEMTINSVASGTGGLARFTTAAVHGLQVDDWVTIFEMSAGNYIGQGKVFSVPGTTTFELTRLFYSVNATGSAVLNKLENKEDESVYLMINLANSLLTDITGNTLLYFETGVYLNYAYAYFDKPAMSLNVDNVKQSLSFQRINNFNFSSTGLLETYFRDFKKVLSDPVMLRANFHLPFAEYNEFRFKYPVRINTGKYNGWFYVNRITGYKGSHLPCEVELIKLP